MADDVTVHNGAGGSGTSFDVATDDDGSGNHIQLVKLVQAANGSRTPIDADTDGLEVKITNASIAVTGTITAAAAVTRKSQTPTISTSAYALGDAVGGLMTFTNCAASSGGSCRIEAVQLVDKADQRAELDLVFFDQTITAPTDNATFDPSDTEIGYCVGRVPIGVGHYASFNDNAVATVQSVGLSCEVVGTSLFGVLVARSTPTYTSTSDIVVSLMVTQLD